MEKDFYPPLRDFVTSGPLVAPSSRATRRSRWSAAINGATDGRKAAPGTIRGDLSLSNRENLVHGSDSPESAAREIAHLVPRAGLTGARAQGAQDEAVLDPVEHRLQRQVALSGRARRAAGRAGASTAKPCTADQHTTSAPGRRSGCHRAGRDALVEHLAEQAVRADLGER